MTCKKLLTLLMVACMIFSCMTPAAAVMTGSESRGADFAAREEVGTEAGSGQQEDAAAELGITLRDDTSFVMAADEGVINGSGAAAAEGSWKAVLSEDEIDLDLAKPQIPSNVEELRQIAQNYGVGEKVTAFVVLDEEPLVMSYKKITEIPQSVIERSARIQEQIADAISRNALNGDALSIIESFSFLTNALVIETEVENLEKIALVEGVKSVFISPVFYACENSAYTVPAGQMTGVSSVWETEALGFTGSGITVAILDTGLDLDHPSFAAAPAGAAWSREDVAAMLSGLDLKAEELYSGSLDADSLYYSEKVPFTFNYANGTTNVSHADGVGDHGTHVAGIAAANAVEGSGVVGMAPDAQIVVMKVFGPSGGANMYDILNALEDCMRMGVDIANLSLGSAAGFSYAGVAAVDDIFANISTTGLIVEVAAGNEGTSAYGSLWGNYMNTTENVDTATVSSPATYANSLAVASVENNYVMASYFTLSDGSKVFYQPSVEYLYGYVTTSLADLAGQDLEYVMVPGVGLSSDYEGIDVEGKIAVVARGEASFAEKAFNAELAGAAAVIIWDNVSEDIFAFGMTTESEGMYPGIPVALVSIEDGEKMEAAEDKTIAVSAEQGLRIDSNGGQMSSFSSWGVSPDLQLLPDIAGVGGNIYSCYDGGSYGLMSGTSMATPQVAGVTALVMQYLKEKFPEASVSEMRALVDGLLMSTAEPLIDAATGIEASPRQQGAGLVNALSAVTSEAYLSVDGSFRPKQSLGDDPNGSYSFSFNVHNFGDEAKTYTLGSSLMCEDYAVDDNYPGVYFMAEQNRALSGSSVSFSADSVTVAPGSSAVVTVSIRLGDSDKNWIDSYFPNGNYVEGFVYLYDCAEEGGVDLSLPFLGFYGDWADAPILDTGFWYENSFWEGVAEVDLSNVDGEQYWTVPWTSLGASSTDWVLGFNPYTGATVDEDGNIIYSSKNNVVSPNGDGLIDSISDYYISTLRNARSLYLSYTDSEGNVVDVEELEYIPKTMYNSNYGSTVPFVYTWYFDGLYDFTDENGDYLPHGTELTLTITAMLDGEDEISDEKIEIPVYVDTEAPVIELDPVEFSQDGKNCMTITIKEEHIAYASLVNSNETQLYGEFYEDDFTDNGNGTVSLTLDITDLGDKFKIMLADYGANESTYELLWTQGDNLPEMDENALYAYQVYDEYLYYYYGYDYMFGWTTVDKQTAEVNMLQSDMYEYYAITAAEYVDGYIFAFDAGGNFLYMTPGLWDRNVISGTGLNVIDMAFDDVSDTMYLATSDADNYCYCLYTIDLLTGELECLWDYGSKYSVPWAMTFVDGELYCCKYYYSGFYKVDLEEGYYQLNAVTMEDGSKFMPLNASGSNTSPQYAQSMTYSEEDGLIYWMYYSGSSCELITIDPEAWTSSALPMDWDREYVGVLTLDETDYVIPESEAVTKLVISDEMIVMGVDEVYQLLVSALPWNAPAAEISWSSQDESVATVEDGYVTSLAEGVTIISASCGDMSVECVVNVVDISGTLQAYDYYSGDGETGSWLSIDLETMSESSICYSDVDFIAADYNGHKGLTYGYDEYGQLYSCDPATGECTAIGSGTGKFFADMAYDYSSGLMYAIVYDYNSWSTVLYYVDLNSGKLVEAATVYDVFMTLACDMDGILYGINCYGELYILYVMEGEAGDIGGWEPWSDGSGEVSHYIETVYVMQTPVNGLNYAQSMCYDHNNNVILWVCPEMACIYWMDVLAENPYAIDLGDPTASGLIEYLGLHVIPEEIPELPEILPETMEAEDMLLLVGQSVNPAVSVSPVNSNAEYSIAFSSSDEAVVAVEDGKLLGVSDGSATVTAVLSCGDISLECSFNVAVKKSTGNLYAYLMQDLANFNGYTWIEIPDTDPVNYSSLEYVYYKGAYLTLYSAEYVDGYVYAYGYDDTDWEANFQFLTIDPSTWSVVSAVDMGGEFPFVYDMAFDYTTGAMYALAGTQTSTDLYYVNLANGELIECMLLGSMFLSLAVDGDGTIYAMEQSTEEFDWFTWTSTYTNALLYTVDVAGGSCELFMDTGVVSNMVSSMCYDFDTGYIYWISLNSQYQGALNLIDLEEMAVYQLGSVGASASQATGLMSFAEAYPDVPENISMLTTTSALEEIAVGDTVKLEAFYLPSTAEVELQWSSDDESVATVDENGVVTGVSAGTCTVTVTVVDGDNVFTASVTIVVYGEDGYFITYNWTDGGFAHIARPDPATVVNQTEGETEPAVRAMAMVNGYIFAYDENGDMFITTEDSGFDRNYIGNCGIELQEPYDEIYASYSYHYEYTFAVRDMAWDDANDRLLAVGSLGLISTYSANDGSYSYTSEYELDGGCILYEVDMETGELNQLCVVGGEDFPESGVYMLTVDGSGQAYIYSTFMDWVSKLDTDTGALTNISTLQNQGVYGATDGEPMAMTYDSVTDTIYMLFTTNGNFYQMFTFNVGTGAMSKVNNVGEVVYDAESWANMGDMFAGLLINEKHVCEYETEVVEATCTEDGYEKNDCPLCGYYEVIPAHGHEYELGDNYVYTCVICGHSYQLDVGIIGDEEPDLPDQPDEPDEPDLPDQPDEPVWPFIDVEEDDWFYGAVAYVYEAGLMNGMSESIFAPNGTVTRAMVVQTLYRMAGSPQVSGSNSFIDLSADWYKDAVQWAVETGVTTGRSDTIFDPDANVTRQELAAFICRYAEYCLYDTDARADLSVYSDAAQIGGWAYDYMSWANAEGLITGRSETLLVPGGTATRAELATILMRFCENVAK